VVSVPKDRIPPAPPAPVRDIAGDKIPASLEENIRRIVREELMKKPEVKSQSVNP
jgi:hypothetical protein